MDQSELGEFLRARRSALQPEDVGLPRGRRRRTSGLRREEVATLAEMSTDYYARIERGAGPNPSDQMVTALARALRLTLLERDHLFVLAGHSAPDRTSSDQHVSPGLMRVLDRMPDTPAQVMSGLGVTLVQTRPAVALLGDQTRFTGPERSIYYRWFTDPASRLIYADSYRPKVGRTFLAQLRRSAAEEGPRSPAAAMVRQLRGLSPEFAALWSEQEVGLTFNETKHFNHPEVGHLELHCQTLLDPDQWQSLLVFTATPGTESYEKLALLTVLGDQELANRAEPSGVRR